MKVLQRQKSGSPTTTANGRRPGIRDRLRARVLSSDLDQALAEGVPPETSPALALRAEAIADEGSRRELGHMLQRILRRQPQPVPVSSRIRACSRTVAFARGDLNRLARRLLSNHPVTVRGVAQARMLLTDGTGPLFCGGDEDELGRRVQETLDALEPGSSGI